MHYCMIAANRLKTLRAAARPWGTWVEEALRAGAPRPLCSSAAPPCPAATGVQGTTGATAARDNPWRPWRLRGEIEPSHEGHDGNYNCISTHRRQDAKNCERQGREKGTGPFFASRERERGGRTEEPVSPAVGRGTATDSSAIMAAAPSFRSTRRGSFNSFSLLRISLPSVFRPTTNRPRRLRPTKWVIPRNCKAQFPAHGRRLPG